MHTTREEALRRLEQLLEAKRQEVRAWEVLRQVLKELVPGAVIRDCDPLWEEFRKTIPSAK